MSLEEFQVEDGVLIKYLGKNKNVTIPEGITRISADAFSQWRYIWCIMFPSTVRVVEDGAFEKTSGLQMVYAPSVESWCQIDFKGIMANPLFWTKELHIAGQAVTNLVIPEGVKRIGQRSFLNCSQFKSITLPDSLEECGVGAFCGCEALKKVYCSSIVNWQKIRFDGWEANPLYYAQNLYIQNELVKVLKIPEGMLEIPDNAYSNGSFESVELPTTVQRIGHHAFWECKDLKMVALTDNLREIGGGAFGNCTSLRLHLPTSVEKTGEYAFQNVKRVYKG